MFEERNVKRPFTAIDWLCITYIVFVGLVLIANIVVHIVGPW